MRGRLVWDEIIGERLPKGPNGEVARGVTTPSGLVTPTADDFGELFAPLSEIQKRMLIALSCVPGVLKASRLSGTSARSHWLWLQTERSKPEEEQHYTKAFEHAKMLRMQVLEQEAHMRALIGTYKAVWHKGRKVGYIREVDNNLLFKMLQAENPNKYSPALRQQQPDDNTGHVEVILEE